ncbi:YncE family protein [Sphingomonas mesophila]|uniref:YncE family protein n=1 Tax=Sphingomonas mesophila TaxID=2303576 RepID=UPI000E593C21|nr:cytochrome D1 domain-containing protein [Sphingomonas mesophila]
MRLTLALGLLIAATAAPAAADTLVVGNKAEHTLSFIDLATGREVARRPTGRAPHELAVSPDGKTVLAVSYREPDFAGSTLHRFDIATAAARGKIDLAGHKGLHGLKWVGRGRTLVITSEVTRNVAVVDAVAGKLLASIPTDQDGSHMVAVSNDGRRAFVANIGSGSFTAIDLVVRAKLRDVAVGAGAEAIALTPDGRQLWVGANEARKVMLFDARSLARLGEFPTEGVPIRIEFSPDGRVAAISEPDRHRVVVLDARTRKTLATVDLAAAGYKVPVTMLFAPDGKRLWVAATGSGAVAEIDTKSWRIMRRLAAGKGADGLAFSRVDSRP